MPCMHVERRYSVTHSGKMVTIYKMNCKKRTQSNFAPSHQNYLHSAPIRINEIGQIYSNV